MKSNQNSSNHLLQFKADSRIDSKHKRQNIVWQLEKKRDERKRRNHRHRNEARGLKVKNYYKDIIIKTASFSHEKREIDWWNHLESPERNHLQTLNLWQILYYSAVGKGWCFNKWYWVSCIVILKTNKRKLLPHHSPHLPFHSIHKNHHQMLCRSIKNRKFQSTLHFSQNYNRLKTASSTCQVFCTLR